MKFTIYTLSGSMHREDVCEWASRQENERMTAGLLLIRFEWKAEVDEGAAFTRSSAERD